MVAMIKRIHNLAGKHKSKILLGILFNFLKSVCMAMVLWAVYIVASDLDSLTMDVIWKALAVLCISVLGRFFFQWLMDISMSAKGFDIFRDSDFMLVPSCEKHLWDIFPSSVWEVFRMYLQRQ